MVQNIRFTNVSKNSAGLRTKGGGTSADADTQNAIIYRIGDNYYRSGTITTIDLSNVNDPNGSTTTIADGEKNVIVVTLDSSGNESTYLGTAGTNYSDVKKPEIDKNGEAVIGEIWIGNATGSDFTVGTTNLDATDVTTTFVDVADANA